MKTTLKFFAGVAILASLAYAVETTLASLPANTFGAPVTTMDQAHVDAVNAIVTAQNANNTSLRAAINGPIFSSQLDPATIQFVSVPLALADLQALFATPKVLVAAPAAGSALEFLGATLEYTKGSAAFTIGSAGNVTVNFKSDASGGAVSTTRAATGFFDQTGVKISRLGPITTTIDMSALTAQPLVLTVATADMTSGTGSSGVIKVSYRVISGL